MNKKLARMVLALAGESLAGNALIAQETVAMMIVEEWHYTPRSSEMHDMVAEWRNKGDYPSAVALASWLLAQ